MCDQGTVPSISNMDLLMLKYPRYRQDSGVAFLIHGVGGHGGSGQAEGVDARNYERGL